MRGEFRRRWWKGAAGRVVTADGFLSPRRLAAVRIEGLGGRLQALLRQEVEARSLFNWLPVAMGLGILAYFAADREPVLPAVLITTLAMAILAFAARRRATAFAVFLGLAMLLTGFSLAALRTRSVTAPQIERLTVTRLTGIVEVVEEGLERHRLLIDVQSAEKIPAASLPAKVRVTMRGPLTVVAGDRVSLTARLLPPPRPILPGGYDFARDAFFKRLGAVGSVMGKVEQEPGRPLLGLAQRMNAAIDRARNDLTRRIADAIGGQQGALTAAMITGKRGLISQERNNDMRAAGIYHIVSISGLHMVLAAGILLWSSRAILALFGPLTARWPTKKLAAALAMLGAVAYCVFSGSEVATVRSLIMTLAILGAILADRPALSMRNLAWSALVVLAIEPEELLGPSFQMSFAAVAGLIAGAGLIKPKWLSSDVSFGVGMLRAGVLWAIASMTTTLVATAATSPFSIFHFHQFTPYGILGNAIAIPVMEFLVMPASIVGLVLLPFGLDGPIWSLTGLGVGGVLDFAGWVSGIPGARLPVPGVGSLALVLFSLGFLLLVLLSSRLRLLGLPLVLAASAVSSAAAVPDLWIDRRGDAVAVRGADGRLQLFGPGLNAFTLSAWLPAAGDERAAGDPSLKGAARCDPSGCVAALPDGTAIALVRRPTAFEEDCRRAAIVVTPMPAPAWCKPKVKLIDYRVLAETGALQAVWREGRLEVLPSRDPHADRPWWPAFAPLHPFAPASPPPQ